MATSVTFSSATGGLAYSTPLDEGSIAPGGAATAQPIYIRHNGSDPITDCKVYIQPYAGGAYAGTSTPQDDYEELLCWGDNSPSSTSGSGVYVSVDHLGGVGTFANATTTRGSSASNAIALTEDSIDTGTPAGDGVIPDGAEAKVFVRVDVPTTVSCGGGPSVAPDAGLRQFDFVMDYTAV